MKVIKSLGQLSMLCFILFASQGVKAQNIEHDSIQWNASGFLDVLSNVTSEVSCQFFTKTNSIRWVQANGTVVYNLSIASKEGAWADVNQDGSLKYNVVLDGISGSVSVTRSGQSMKILLELSGEHPIKNEYSISGFQIL